jgi:hypothetical protein
LAGLQLGRLRVRQQGRQASGGIYSEADVNWRAFNARGRIWVDYRTKDPAPAVATQYGYAAAGNVTQKIYPSGRRASYARRDGARFERDDQAKRRRRFAEGRVGFAVEPLWIAAEHELRLWHRGEIHDRYGLPHHLLSGGGPRAIRG